MSAPSPAVRDAVLRRDGGLCVGCGLAVAVEDGGRMRPITAYSLQHRLARGMGGRSVDNQPHNLLTTCGSATTPGGCHQRMESQPEWARTRGYRVDSWDSPETVPVTIRTAPGVDEVFVLDDDRRVRLEPGLDATTVRMPSRPCRVGDHHLCYGNGWDMSADAPIPCPCKCHGGAS